MHLHSFSHRTSWFHLMVIPFVSEKERQQKNKRHAIKAPFSFFAFDSDLVVLMRCIFFLVEFVCFVDGFFRFSLLLRMAEVGLSAKIANERSLQQKDCYFVNIEQKVLLIEQNRVQLGRKTAENKLWMRSTANKKRNHRSVKTSIKCKNSMDSVYEVGCLEHSKTKLFSTLRCINAFNEVLAFFSNFKIVMRKQRMQLNCLYI